MSAKHRKVRHVLRPDGGKITFVNHLPKKDPRRKRVAKLVSQGGDA
jgi:hypothetical protein